MSRKAKSTFSQPRLSKNSKKPKNRNSVKKHNRDNLRQANSRRKPSRNIASWLSRWRASSWYVPFLLTVNLLAVAVGLCTIVGTTIAIANSLWATPPTASVASEEILAENASENATTLEKFFPISAVGKELTDLKTQIESLAAKYPQLKPKIFLADLDRKSYVSIDSQVPVASASTIKLPILVAFFQDVDAGQIDLQEQLTITKEVVAGGSGGMQYEPLGTRFTALETATQMMTTSDNTATNMLIERLGGKDALNQRFSAWSLTATRIRNPLPDLTGTNTTSPEDLGNLLAQLARGELVSLKSRDRLLYIMRNIVSNTLLPEGLGADAIIAHKTGDIKKVLGDAGIIDLANGNRYIAAVLVERPDNDPDAKEFIQQLSQVSYQYFRLLQSGSFTN